MRDCGALAGETRILRTLVGHALGGGDGERGAVGLAGERLGAELSSAHGVDVAHGHVVGLGRGDIGAHVVDRVGKRAASGKIGPRVGERGIGAGALVGRAVLLDRRGELDGRVGAGADLGRGRLGDGDVGVAVLAGAHEGEVHGVGELGLLGLIGEGVGLGPTARERERLCLGGGVGVARAVRGAREGIAHDVEVVRLRERGGRSVLVATRAHGHAIDHEGLARSGRHVVDRDVLRGLVGLFLGHAVHALHGALSGEGHLACLGLDRVGLAVGFKSGEEGDDRLSVALDRRFVSLDLGALLVDVDHGTLDVLGGVLELRVTDIEHAVPERRLIAVPLKARALAADDRLRGREEARSLTLARHADADHGTRGAGVAARICAHGVDLGREQRRGVLVAVGGLCRVEVELHLAAVLANLIGTRVQLHDAEGIGGVVVLVLHVLGDDLAVNGHVGIERTRAEPRHGGALERVAPRERISATNAHRGLLGCGLLSGKSRHRQLGHRGCRQKRNRQQYR